MLIHPTPSKVVILGTGGTIAGSAAKPGDNVGYVAGQVAVEDLMRGLPNVDPASVEAEQVAQLNSKDMSLAVWKSLLARLDFHLKRDEVSGVVVTHGTDTIEETAYLIHRVLQPSKPVVLTCAMRPASAISPDGPQNLSDAHAVAQWPGACGVLVVCAGQVHSAVDVAKVHPYRVDPFRSGDAGPVACVEEGVIRRFRPWPECLDRKDQLLTRVLEAESLPRVALLTSHADADGALVDALIELGRGNPAKKVQAIVVAATGNGSLHESLQKALALADSDGIRVGLASRCLEGRVVPYSAQPFPDVMGLPPVKARLEIALQLLLV